MDKNTHVATCKCSAIIWLLWDVQNMPKTTNGEMMALQFCGFYLIHLLKRSHSGEVESDSPSKCFQSKIQISPSLARLKWFASYKHNSTVMYGTYTIWFWISANCMQMFAKQVVLLLVEQCQLTGSANMLESNSGKLIKF